VPTTHLKFKKRVGLCAEREEEESVERGGREREREGERRTKVERVR